jgi:hypothetical protein
MADWHSGVSQGADPNPPIVIADPGTVPPDPEDPPPGDVEAPSPDGEPADDADDRPPGPAPAPLATTITVRSGRTTTAVLPSTDGVPSRFRIVGSPDVGTIDVRPTSPLGSDPGTTGPDGAVDITPAPGFVGTASFLVAPGSEGAESVRITVDVVPASAPSAADDQIQVDRGAVVMIEPETLLGNDRPPADPPSLTDGAPLRIVSVYGFAEGTAVLRLDGRIEVQADGPGSFMYSIADDSGATDTARVVVQLTPVAPPTITPPTAPTAPTPPTTAPPTLPATPTTSPSPAVPAIPIGTPGATPPPPNPADVTLPSTGGNLAQPLRLAATMCAVGVALVVVVRRRSPASRRR